MTGKFITFEGCEGAGKTTQCRILLEYLKSKNIPVVITKEPGGTELANHIRNIIISDYEISDTMTEFLLISAARRDHIQNFILPNLLAGKVVICDRFFDSSLVYQGYCKGLSMDFIHDINYQVSPIVPDITFILDLDPKIAKKRVLDRNSSMSHYDKRDIEFYKRIREGFLHLKVKDGDRFNIVDASLPEDSVAIQIIENMKNILT